MSRKPNEFIDDEENNDYESEGGMEKYQDEFFLEEPDEQEDSFPVEEEDYLEDEKVEDIENEDLEGKEDEESSM